MTLLVSLLILWLLSPFALIPIMIVYICKYNQAQKTIVEMKRGTQQVVSVQSVPQQVQQPQSVPIQQVQQVQPVQNVQQKNQVIHRHVVQTPEVVTPAMKKSHRIQISMVVGVLLLLASALIFATTTWNVIPQLLKVVVIASVSAIFYIASYLARKKFDLEITSMAFYQLGCFFTPIAILCIGFFRLLGDFFALEGNAAYFVFFIMALSFSISATIGNRIFTKKVFYYMFQISNCMAIFLLPCSVGLEMRVGVLAVLCYALFLYTKICIEDESGAIKWVHPILVWLCIYQGIFVFHPTAFAWCISSGICGILVFAIYSYLEITGPDKISNIVGRFLSIGTLFIGSIISMADLSEIQSFIHLLILCAVLIYEVKIAQTKVEERVAAWSILIPILLFIPIIYELTMLRWLEIFVILGSIYFVGTLLLIAIHKKSSVANTFIEPLVAATTIHTFIVSLDYPYDFWMVLMVVEVLLLCFLLRERLFFERSFIIGCGFVPLYFWNIGMEQLVKEKSYDLYLEHIETYYGIECLIIALTGMIYLILACYGKKKNYKLQSIIGGIVFYVGAISLFGELLGNGFTLIGVLGGAIMIGGTYYLNTLYKNPFFFLPIQCGVVPFIAGSVMLLIRDKDVEAVLYLLVAAAFMAIGYFYQRTIVVFDENQKVCAINHLTISAFFGLLPALSHRSEYVNYAGLLLLLIYVVHLYNRIGEKSNPFIIGTSCVIGYGLWLKQVFVEIPNSIQCEFAIVGLAMIIGILAALRSKKAYVEWVQFSLAIISILVQVGECLSTEAIEDILFLGIPMVALLIYAQMKQKLRWVILSAVTIVGVLFYVTREFWFSIAWWIYLLVAGLALIGVAIYTEVHKE